MRYKGSISEQLICVNDDCYIDICTCWPGTFALSDLRWHATALYPEVERLMNVKASGAETCKVKPIYTSWLHGNDDQSGK
jgi:hypothetical protein